MGERWVAGCCSQRERVDELENDNVERESRAEERTYTPFLFVLWPSSVAGEEEERGEDGRGAPDWMCHAVIFSNGARIMPERQRLSTELPRLCGKTQD